MGDPNTNSLDDEMRLTVAVRDFSSPKTPLNCAQP